MVEQEYSLSIPTAKKLLPYQQAFSPLTAEKKKKP
jgi:hypothetical protein